MIRISVTARTRLDVVQRTLERIGIANTKTKVITPTCYLVKVGERHFIAHFKELLGLEMDSQCFKDATKSRSGDYLILPEDIARRDNIVSLMVDWGLIKLHETVVAEALDKTPMNFKVLKASEMADWTIHHKYTMTK